MPKMRLRPRLRPDPTVEAHDASPDLVVGWGGDIHPQTPPHLAPSVARPSRPQHSGLPLHIISGYATGSDSANIGWRFV